MKASLLLILLSLPGTIFAQGCIVDDKEATRNEYVCIDGRSLTQTAVGLVWFARRGCFLSRIPCCAYEAVHYGRYKNQVRIKEALAHCRHGYPYHLGEMQTH